MNTLAEKQKVRRISKLHLRIKFVNSEDRHDRLKMFKYIFFRNCSLQVLEFLTGQITKSKEEKIAIRLSKLFLGEQHVSCTR